MDIAGWSIGLDALENRWYSDTGFSRLLATTSRMERVRSTFEPSDPMCDTGVSVSCHFDRCNFHPEVLDVGPTAVYFSFMQSISSRDLFLNPRARGLLRLKHTDRIIRPSRVEEFETLGGD